MLKSITDQMGRTIAAPSLPKRIISIVPSQTELLAYLGLEEEVVGITKFCVHPDTWFRKKTRIGGTKQLNVDHIIDINPDLIIGNKEENDQEQIEALSKHFPIWMSDIKNLSGATEMIKDIGNIIGKSKEALELSAKIQASFQGLNQNAKINKIRMAYFIWQSPFMVVGKDTFIHHILTLSGFTNVFKDQSRYPVISLEDLEKQQPQAILLSSEPFPFKEKHLKVFQNVCPKAVIRIVDGELCSWYGSRLLHTAPYLVNLRKNILNAIHLTS